MVGVVNVVAGPPRASDGKLLFTGGKGLIAGE